MTTANQRLSTPEHGLLSFSLDHIGRLARMSVLETEVDGSNPGSSMSFP